MIAPLGVRTTGLPTSIVTPLRKSSANSLFTLYVALCIASLVSGNLPCRKAMPFFEFGRRVTLVSRGRPAPSTIAPPSTSPTLSRNFSCALRRPSGGDRRRPRARGALIAHPPCASLSPTIYSLTLLRQVHRPPN